MKSFLIVIVIFIFSVGNSYACDVCQTKQYTVSSINHNIEINKKTNFKQQKSEKKWSEKIYTPQIRLNMHCALIQEDYKCHNKGNFETVYEIIQKNLQESACTLNKQYAQMAQVLYLRLISATPDEHPITVKEFEKLKIIVSDEDFDKIDKDLREIIFMLNTY